MQLKWLLERIKEESEDGKEKVVVVAKGNLMISPTVAMLRMMTLPSWMIVKILLCPLFRSLVVSGLRLVLRGLPKALMVVDSGLRRLGLEELG